jgi:hypothetical protein
MNYFILFLLFNFLPAIMSNYDVERSELLAKLSAVTYCPEDSIMDWTCKWCRQLPDFRLVDIIENKQSSVFGIIGRDSRGTSYLVFEGTQDMTDVLYDLQIGKLVPYKDYPDVMVHKGFWNIYQTVREQIMEKIQEYTKSHLYRSSQNRDLYIAGHSLGDAIAFLVGLDLKETTDITFNKIYGFAGPRLGNQAFVDLFENVVGKENYYRITAENDPVVHLPFEWMNYRHLGNEYWYPDYMNITNYIYCPVGENPECANRYKLTFDVEAHRNYMGLTRLSFCNEDDVLRGQ